MVEEQYQLFNLVHIVFERTLDINVKDTVPVQYIVCLESNIITFMVLHSHSREVVLLTLSQVLYMMVWYLIQLDIP